MASTSEQGEDETWDLKFRQDEEMEFFTELALHEAERWISAVTRKKFSHTEDFRKSLENGVILCELLNTIKPGSVKRINKLPTPIAGLDNINVFLNACKKFFHLRDGHLFDPSDLEDLTQRAIADSATELKIESDRRALNVAICIFWLGKSVSTSYSGPQLDQSAFNALVHHHGKDLIPGGHTRQDSVESNGHSSAYGSHDSCSKSESNDVVDNKHLRNNSYDSYGSYSRESEGSFTLEEENDMPAGSRSNMRRYGSAGSLNTSAGMRFSATGSVDVDDMYQSNPDLVNNHHRRGSSTDSMDSSAYNHSRQSSEDIGIPTRTTRAQRKTSTASVDPLQFVKSKPSDALAKQAKEQIKAAQEVKSVRTKIEKEDEDWQSITDTMDNWQSNLSSWKTKRRRASSAAYQRVEETDNLAQEEEEKKKPKTYSQMMEAREKRKSTGMLNFYPLGDEEDSLTWTPKTNTRDEEPVEETFSKSQTRRTESGPSSRLVERFKRSSSGGDSYVKYDDQNVADWAKGEGDDEDANKQKTESLSRESSNVRKSEDIAPKSRTLDDRFNRGKTSDITKRYSEVTPPSFRDSNKERTPENMGSSGKSTSKISNILRNFETKNEDASQAKPKKAFEFSVETGRKREKWQNLEKQEINKGISKPVSNSKPVGKLADQHFSKVKHDSLETRPGTTEIKSFVEKNIKINQKANNAKGFGFTIEGGVDKKQPVTVHRVNIGSAADVCEVKTKDQIIAINKKDIGHMTQPMVQHMIDNSVKIGQIELKIKRPISEEVIRSKSLADLDWPVLDDDLEDEAFESESPPILPHLKTDHNYSPTNYSSTANQTSVTSHFRNSPVTKKEELPSHHLNEEKKTSPPVPAKRGSQKGRIREDPEEQKKWILEHLKSASAEEADKEEPNNNDLKQEESSESESESDVDEPPPVISPPKQEIVIRPQIEVPKRQEVQRQPENEITETRPTISVRRSPAPEPIPVTEQITPQLTKKTESVLSPEPQEAPPPPPSAAPPPLKYSNLDVDGFKPPDILKRWQRGSRGTRSDYSSSPTSMDSDGEKRLSSSSFSWQNEFNNTGGSQTSPGSTMSYEKDYPDPHMEPQVGQPITLHLETAPGQLIIDPRNQGDYEEPGLPQYNFHVDFSKQNNKEDDIGQRQVEKYEDEEAVRLREREERIRQQEEELRLQKEQLRQEQERMKQEKEQMERFKTLDLEETAPSQRNGHYKPTEDMASQYKPTESVTQFSVNSDATRAQPRKLEEVWNPNNPLNKEKQRWSREDMLAMNRKATPLQTKPENEALENDSTKHGVSREPLSRSDIHNLNGAPRPKYKSDSMTSSHRDNKFGDPQMRRRSEYTDPNSHWLVEEAERRREKTSKRHSVHTPYQGPIKPVQDNTTNRWRDDSSVTHQQTFSSSNSGVSPRPVNTQQFSANPRSNLSQTLPPNYNFNSGQKREPVVPPKPMRQMPVSPTSPPSHAEQIMAVSGKQLCSHCSQELGFGAAMVIESLGLYYHVQCFRCCVCHTTLGNGSQGADVRVRVNKLHCRNCYSNDEGMTYLGHF